MNFDINDFIDDEIWPGEAEDSAQFNALNNLNVQLETNEFAEEDKTQTDWSEVSEDLDSIIEGQEDGIVDLEEAEVFIYAES